MANKFQECHNVIDNPKLDSQVTLFICPTYGDEEIHLDMENFLQSLSIKSKEFVICELGNYYGYDDFRFGALKIIQGHLESLGWKQFFRPLSLDSLPEIDWDVFEQWKGELENELQNMGT